MNLTVVRVFPRFGEGKGKMVVGVQRWRVEGFLSAGHGVRLVVVIGPRNFWALRENLTAPPFFKPLALPAEPPETDVGHRHALGNCRRVAFR